MNDKKVVFFIENNSHLRFLENIIYSYYYQNINIEIVSIQKINFELNIFNRVLNNDIEKIAYLKNLSCTLFFTTTPNIGSSYFPKSSVSSKKNRPKYIYIFHSLVSPIEMYKKNSFKNFEYIISPSITVSEQLKNLISSNTKILSFGYSLFDNLEPFKFKNEKSNSILIAPSWGDKGLSKNYKYLDDINYLKNYKVVFRPHPMDIDDFVNIELNNLSLDLNLELNNLHMYEILITDCSGIALEFFYLTGRPILFIDVFNWWPEAESNCRPLVFQTSALPTELSGRMAGTTGFEPATSCVTGRRELQTSPRPRNI
jgi:hypothetical protein